MTFEQAAQRLLEPPRDRWNRPLIVPPEGGEAIAYTRVSTMAKVLDDTGGLRDWDERNVALGISMRADLQVKTLGIGPIERDDPDAKSKKKEMRAVVEEAKNAAKSKAAANMGTGIHAFTEKADAGQDLSLMPPQIAPDIQAYRHAIISHGLTPVLAETFVVVDELRAAGSFDRLWRLHDGRHVIGDLKTGWDAPEYPHNIAVQMACYAHGYIYDVENRHRYGLPEPIDRSIGLLMHLRPGSATCDIYILDLVAGWEAAKVSAWVHGTWRKNNRLVTKW